MRQLALAVLFGCVGSTALAGERASTQESYHIISFQTAASTSSLGAAGEKAVRRFTTDLHVASPVVMGPLPSEMPRFTLENPLANSPLAGLVAMAGASAAGTLKVAKCDNGATWVMNANRSIGGSQSLRVTACLYPFMREGQRSVALQIFSADTVQKGGALDLMAGRALAKAVVGKPEEFSRKMVLELITAVEAAAGVQGRYEEGQGELGDPRFSLASQSPAS